MKQDKEEKEANKACAIEPVTFNQGINFSGELGVSIDLVSQKQELGPPGVGHWS